MDDPRQRRRNQLGERFDVESWPGEGDAPIVVTGFEFGERDLPGYRRHRVVSPPAPPGVVGVRQSVWLDEKKPAADDAILLVDVHECRSHEEARNVLLDLLADVQAMEVARVEGVGNVAFSPGQGAVLFVRGNLAVRVLAGGPGALPVLDAARAADAAVLARTGRGRGSARR